MENRILEICSELCCQELSQDEELIATDILDSFKIMELICRLEEEFDIVFLPEEIMDMDNFSCVNHMMAIVNNKIRS